MVEQNGHLQATAADVVASIGERWVDGRGPLYEKLARALQEAVDHGHLPSGAYLPSERVLARSLFVSRSTVVSAYGLLRRNGALGSRRGSGTWVCGRSAGRFGDEETLGILARDPYLSGVIDESPAPIDFTLPAPRAALDEIRGAGLLDRVGTGLLADAAPLGYEPRGLRSLRRALIRLLESRGLPTSEDEILITNGGQQAISLLLGLFVRPGDEIVVENPSYRGLIDAVLFSRARVLPVGIEDTALPARLRALASEHAPQLVYLTTTCHNPTGSNVDAEVRREVARIAVEFGVPLVEDMVLADLSLELPPPPVATFARRSAPIIVVGSLSKVIWGGLRIGWIRAPAPIVSRLARLKAVADMGTSAVSQLVALELLPALEDRILDVQRREVKRSLELAEELFGTHTPNWRWTRPKGGRSLWIRLPHGDGQDFARLALSHGVALSAGTTLSFDGSFEPYVRVQFVQPPGLLREGVRRLGMAWDAYSAGMVGGAGSDAVLRES